MNDDPCGAVDTEHRRLAAIMFTDIVGFSRQMGADEARMLRLLEVHNQIVSQAVAAHHGHVIKTIGDAFLVDFPSVVNAVQCAQTIQVQLWTHNAGKDRAEQIHVRIGIHLGDIVQRDGDVFGDGVNIAARLQSLAAPDSICISDMVYRDVVKKVDLGTVVSLGKPKLKNIAERFAVYALLPEPPKSLRQRLQVQRLKLSRRVTPTQRMMVVGLLFIAATVVGVHYLPSSSPNPQPLAPSTQSLPLPDKPSIVVLPFTNMSNDPEQEYFSDGLTEDLITDLSKFSGLFVIARHSAFTYKDKAVKVEEVGRELGVRYILEGSTRKAGEQLRFTAQLVEAATGLHVWAERYDRPLTDIFTVQDEIVQQIGAALRVEVPKAEQARVRRIPTENLNAYDAVLRGMESAVHFTPEGIAQARQWFERALALDPQYAAAYARLSWTYWMEWLWWTQDPLLLKRAGELARQALALDDSLPTAHMIMGIVYLWRDQQYEQAIAEGKHAVALDPNWADAYVGLTDILNFAGRAEEAVGLVQKAMRLNPHYPAVYSHVLGVAYNLTGQYEEAITASKEALRRNPNFLPAYTFLAGSYLAQWVWQRSQDPQTLERAAEAAQQAVALSDSTYWTHDILSIVYLWQKHHELALAEAERALALNSQDALSQAHWANVLNLAGRAEESLARMEQVTCSTAYGTGPPLCFLVLGDAYALMGRHEEAITAYKQVLSNKPGVADRLGAHLSLAVLYSELGKEAEARAEVAELLRLNPKFSLEVHKQRVPIKDPAVLERHIAALRKAGLK